jgi:hypothetical protein
VAGVFTTALQFLKSGKSLVARTPLESLRLRQAHGRLRDLAACPAIAPLAELRLEDRLITTDPKGLHALLSSPLLDRLRILQVDSASFTVRGAEHLASASRLANLTELHLVGTVLGDDGLRRLAASPLHETCTVLRLVRSRITSAGVASLAGFHRLAELDLSLNDLGATGAIALANALSGSTLHRLWLRDTHPGREGLAAVAGAPGVRQLRWLDLDGCELGDDALEALATPNLGRLTHLDLYNNNLTDRGAILLARMPNLTDLRALDIGLSEVTDDGAIALAESPWLAQLSWLGLWNTPIGGKGRVVLRERFGSRLRFEFPGHGRGTTNLPGASD